MQKLMPFLMTVRHGAGVPFLLPLLLQALATSQESRPADPAAWLRVLMGENVGASFIPCLLQNPACARETRKRSAARLDDCIVVDSCGATTFQALHGWQEGTKLGCDVAG